MGKVINDYGLQSTFAASGDLLLFQRGSQYYKLDASTLVDHLDTDDFTEGSSNLFATTSNLDTWLGTKDSDDVTEGSTNLFATTSNLNTWLATKTTDNLTAGATTRLSKYTETTLNSVEVLALNTTPKKIVDTTLTWSLIKAVEIEVSTLGAAGYTTTGNTNLEIVAGNSAGTLFASGAHFEVPVTVLSHNVQYCFPFMHADAAEIRVPQNYDWYIRPDTADPTVGDVEYTVRVWWDEWAA